MFLYYSILKMGDEPSLVLEEKRWFDENESLDGPNREKIDQAAKKAGLEPAGAGAYLLGGRTVRSVMEALRKDGNSVAANTRMH